MNGFLPLLNSGFHWDNGAMKWQQSSERRVGEIERIGRKKKGVQASGKSLQITTVLPTVPVSGKQRGILCSGLPEDFSLHNNSQSVSGWLYHSGLSQVARH